MADAVTYLAYDLGAESGRALAGTFAGGKLTVEEVHRFWNLPHSIQGTMYWDIFALFRDMQEGMTKFIETRGAPVAVGIDTWGVDFGLLAADGSILAPPVCYRDHRNDHTMDEVLKDVAAERIYDRTGVQFMQFNSAYQLAGIARRTPGVLEAADCLMFMGDLLAWFFCGRKATEYTIASTSQLIDPRTRAWAEDLMQELGIPPRIMPELVEAGTVLGNVDPALSGGHEIPLVAVAHHDTGSAVVAVPAEGADWACISCGTWSILGTELPEPLVSDKTLACNFSNEGGVCGTTRLMKNLSGLWPLQECRRKWVRSEPDLDYTTITQRAAEARPFPAILFSDYPGFLNPPDMETAIRDFCIQTGQTPPEGQGEMARAIVEGLALGYRRVLDMLEGLTGSRYDKLHIVGGGTQNELLMQFAANATGRTVVAGPIEATAIGNLIMQGIATGRIGSLDEGREIVRNSFPMKTFEPQDVDTWQAAYEKLQTMI